MLGNYNFTRRRCDLNLLGAAIDGSDFELAAFIGQNIDAHFRHAIPLEAKELCTTPRNIDDPAACERPAVIDPQHNGTSVFQVRNPNSTGQRQRAVRGCHVILVIGFAVGRFLAVKVRAIPGCDSGLGILVIFGGVIPDTLDLIG